MARVTVSDMPSLPHSDEDFFSEFAAVYPTGVEPAKKILTLLGDEMRSNPRRDLLYAWWEIKLDPIQKWSAEDPNVETKEMKAMYNALMLCSIYGHTRGLKIGWKQTVTESLAHISVRVSEYSYEAKHEAVPVKVSDWE